MTLATDNFTSEELRTLWEDSDEPRWWVAPIRRDGTEVDGVRQLVRFRFRDMNRVAVNAHDVEWEDTGKWGVLTAFGAWRSQHGGERLALTAFSAIRINAGDCLCVPAGQLRLPAEDLEG